MSDWNSSTNLGATAPATAAARPQDPYQQPAPAYRPPVILGQGNGQAAASAPAQPVIAPRDALAAAQIRAGDKAQQLSLVFGVLSFVTLPLLFGPLAIWQGNKAEALDRYGNAGRVLGWIAIILSLLAILTVVVVVMLVAKGMGTSPIEALMFLAVAVLNPQALAQQAGV